MKRREVITLLSGAAVWPLAAGAQQPDRVRRIGVLNGLAEADAETQTYDAAFRKRLDELGWIDGRNIQSTIAGVPAASSACDCSRRS